MLLQELCVAFIRRGGCEHLYHQVRMWLKKKKSSLKLTQSSTVGCVYMEQLTTAVVCITHKVPVTASHFFHIVQPNAVRSLTSCFLVCVERLCNCISPIVVCIVGCLQLTTSVLEYDHKLCDRISVRLHKPFTMLLG